MKRIYHSLEDLRSDCANSKLLIHVASTLRICSNNGDHWNFVSAVENGDEYHTEFDLPVKNSDVVFHLSTHGNSCGHYGHISTKQAIPMHKFLR